MSVLFLLCPAAPPKVEEKVEFEKVEFMRSGFSAFLQPSNACKQFAKCFLQ